MKETMTILLFTFLFSISLPANQDLHIMLPITVDLKAEKSVLRPGETVKITLQNFRDENNRVPTGPTAISDWQRIIVRSNVGLIMDGTELDPAETPQIIGSTKVFMLGKENKLDIFYRAPLRGKSSEVNVEIFNSPDFGPTENDPLASSTKGQLIANVKLEIKWGTYLLLNYEENKRKKSGSKVLYTHEINAVVRIDCEPWQTGSMLKIASLEVLEFSGRADRISSHDHEIQKAVSAKPSFYNVLVMLHLDPKTEKILGIIYDSVPINVDWQGDDIAEGPPEIVHVGPVSIDERGPWGARWEGYKLKSDLPKEGKSARRIRRMQQFLIQNFAETQVHPDHIVKTGDGKTFWAGQGKWEKSSGGNVHSKTYTWELHTTK